MSITGEPLSVQWKRGSFQTFYALAKIRVGGATELSINEGDEFEYDGSVLKYEGREIPQPSLRGSFRQGWVSDAPPGEEGNRIPPHQATRNVARSQSVNRDLANVQRTGPRSITSDNLDEDTVLNVSDRSSIRGSNGRGHLTADNNRRQASARGMRVDVDEVEAQEGVEIGRIRTSTHFKGDITKPQNAGLKDKLENLSGSGYVRDRNAPVLEQGRSTGKVIHKEGVTIRTNVGNVDRTVRAEADEESIEVGRVRHTDRRGGTGDISFRDTSNIRNERAVVQTKAAPVKAYKVDTKLHPKVRVARAIDPSFPSDWSFEGKLADRLKAVKQHGATPEFLDALYAAEGDQMRKALEKAFPKQFSGT